jgi:hypothetical protein
MDRRFFVIGSGAITISSLAGCAGSEPIIRKVDSSVNTPGLAISILKDEMYSELDKMNDWGKSLNFENWDYADQGSKVSRIAKSSATFDIQPVYKNEVMKPKRDLTQKSASGFEMAVVDAPKFFYKSGEYMLARKDKKGLMTIDPVSNIYMTGVMNILSRVRVKYARVATGVDIRIDAIYTGGSDDLPIVGSITWAPAIGNFQGDVLLNGVARRMTLTGGQAIRSNEELALARAVAMSRELDKRLAERKHAALPAKFEIEVSRKAGQLYRFAKIRFTPVQV